MKIKSRFNLYLKEKQINLLSIYATKKVNYIYSLFIFIRKKIIFFSAYVPKKANSLFFKLMFKIKKVRSCFNLCLKEMQLCLHSIYIRKIGNYVVFQFHSKERHLCRLLIYNIMSYYVIFKFKFKEKTFK